MTTATGGPGAPDVAADIVVAIDGPAGAGKSTVARAVAAAARLRYLDTGATYRAVTVGLLRAGVDLASPGAVAAALPALRLELRGDPGDPGRIGVWLDGAPLAHELRAAAVNAAVSGVSAVAAVRERLVALQRSALHGGGVVVEGRDIGTVVCPDADVKVFLSADPAERARRRGSQEGADAAAAVAARDRIDGTRVHSPLRPAGDAVRIDSTHLPEQAVVDRVLELVAAARARVGADG